MPKLNGKVPKYRLHKVSGQAIVTLDGEDRYLGEHGSQESKAKYDRLIAEWLANGRRNANPQAEKPTLTVNQIVAAYWEYAKSYYRKPDGTPTMEIETLRQALKPPIHLYGDKPASEFGPLALKAVPRACRLRDPLQCRHGLRVPHVCAPIPMGRDRPGIGGRHRLSNSAASFAAIS